MEILSAVNQGMQNIYTPFSPGVHLMFCLLATVVYFLLFYRKGSWHYMLLMAAVDLTYATQTSLCRTQQSIMVLAVIEAVLLLAAFIVYIPYAKKQKAAAKAADKETEEQEKRRREAEQAEQQRDSHPVDNAFEE